MGWYTETCTMKICWDTLEGIKLTKNDVFLKNGNTSYIYREKCKVCGEPYLTIKHTPSLFCSRSCALSGEHHPFYGKHLSDSHKSKLSKAFSGSKNPFYGKHHSKRVREILSKKATGRKFSDESIKKMSVAHIGKHIHSKEYKEKLSKKLTGKGNPMYGHKGVLCPSYGRHMSEETRKKLSNVFKCKYIGKNNPNWKGGISCEPYCQLWTDKEYKKSIKKRDNYICQNPYCYKTSKRVAIHHIDYNKKNCCPENLITLCTGCNSRANTDREWHKAWYQTIMNHKYGYKYK